MLKSFHINGFKSLLSQEVKLPSLAVLFGPNAAGKSNVLDAILALSRIGTQRTLADALAAPLRGYPIEAFSFPAEGLSGLLAEKEASFEFDADLDDVGGERYRYRVKVAIHPESGALSVIDEFLCTLARRTGETMGSPRIETEGDHVLIRPRARPGRPRHEQLGNYAVLSDPRLGGREFTAIERCRKELSGWRIYYLDPRVAMRQPRPPSEVSDIGVLGENIAPFLYRLRSEKEKNFLAIKRTLKSIIPSVDDLNVDLDKRRGIVDVLVRQDGVEYSSRIISEGTLRVLALCSIAANPWNGRLLAFEEPENGVHPRRIELAAKLLASLADRDIQTIVSTHSPLFCTAILKEARDTKRDIGLLRVTKGPAGTEIRSFDPAGPLFTDHEIRDALSSDREDGHFENLLLRGLLDA